MCSIKNFMSYTLGPLWILIGLLRYLDEGFTWLTVFASAAGIMFCLTGYRKWKESRKKSGEE